MVTFVGSSVGVSVVSVVGVSSAVVGVSVEVDASLVASVVVVSSLAIKKEI